MRKKSPTHENALTVQNVDKTFIQAGKKLPVLKKISITFKPGQSYAITGASGSGKSTLLHIVGGLDAPSSGKVSFYKKNLHGITADERGKILNKSIGFVFQFHYLVNELTVLENIMIMGLIRGERKDACASKAKSLLKHFGLLDKKDSYPYSLSGGEQQRISVIRAVFNKPAFLLADEPTGNLDAKNAAKIVDFFIQCKKEWGMGIILCSHDKEVYSKMEHVYELKNGRLANITSRESVGLE